MLKPNNLIFVASAHPLKGEGESCVKDKLSFSHFSVQTTQNLGDRDPPLGFDGLADLAGDDLLLRAANGF